MKHSPSTSREIIDWRVTGLVLTIVLIPLVSLLLFSDGIATVAWLASLDGLMLSPAALVAAVTAYVAYRIRPRRQLGWLTVILGVLSTEMIALSVLQISDPTLDEHHLLPRLSELVVVSVICACLVQGGRRDVPVDPLGLGLALGSVLGVVKLGAVAALDPVAVPMLGRVMLGAVVLAAVVGMVGLFQRLSGVPELRRRELCAVAVLIAVAQLCQVSAQVAPLADTVAVAATAAAAVELALAGLAMLKHTIAEQETEQARVAVQLRHFEEAARDQRARLHEINATLASISNAHSLIRGDRIEVPVQRRARLETMVDAELARLTRLLGSNGALRVFPDGYDVARALDPVLLAHEARGMRITWECEDDQPCRITGDPDHLVEVVNILLDNAAKHGAGAVHLRATTTATDVRITVEDDGPGVPRGVDPFAWGVRGPGSHGQGIGLHIARTVMRDQGGQLRLAPSEPGRGARFVLELPATLHSSDARAHVS